MKRAWIAIASLLALGASPFAPAYAESYEEGRVRTATRLFRALLAADVDLEAKAAPDGALVVVVFFAADRARAEQVESWLRDASTAPAGESVGEAAGLRIRGLPVRIVLASDPALGDFAAAPPAAIFLAERLPDATRDAIVRYGIGHRVVVNSPFEGDVEAGVLGGVSIEAQVRPLVNRGTLVASRIELKSFFLKVSKVIE
jgi:hypothetical protein